MYKCCTESGKCSGESWLWRVQYPWGVVLRKQVEPPPTQLSSSISIIQVRSPAMVGEPNITSSFLSNVPHDGWGVPYLLYKGPKLAFEEIWVQAYPHGQPHGLGCGTKNRVQHNTRYPSAWNVSSMKKELLLLLQYPLRSTRLRMLP